MSFASANIGNYKNVSATANIKPVDGAMLGVFCSSITSTPTLQLYDSATTTTTLPITGVITLTAGTFYQIPVCFLNGLCAVISGTANITVVTL